MFKYISALYGRQNSTATSLTSGVHRVTSKALRKLKNAIRLCLVTSSSDSERTSMLKVTETVLCKNEGLIVADMSLRHIMSKSMAHLVACLG